MNTRELLESFRIAHNSLHRCWTKAVGTKDYRKSDWIELEGILFQLGRATADAIGYKGHLLPHLLP